MKRGWSSATPPRDSEGGSEPDAPDAGSAEAERNVGLPTRRSRQLVYSNDWITVHEDQLIYAHDRPGIYGVVSKSDFSLVIPVLSGMIGLIRQYRYPIATWKLEFPQGSASESTPQESMLHVAQRELREESGLTASRLWFLGFFHESYGLGPSTCHVFLADVEASALPSPEYTEILSEPVWSSPKEFWRYVASGDISDGPSIAAMGLAFQPANADLRESLGL
ncbi:MAG: NUDIX hydrolase [Bifidobacteriaceae bacterium]|nr:NUDIX hydrolase [Bifidobacteriaceae bacterium]